MIQDVRVYTPDGVLKKVISGKKLSKDHWKNFKRGKDILSTARSEYQNKKRVAKLLGESK